MSLLDTASLLLTPNAYKEGKLYSVIPSNGNGDFTATRATTATRVNADGLVDLVPYNLVQYSEQFENVSWAKINGSSIASNSETAPDGTLTADTIIEGTGYNQFGVTQGYNVTQGTAYTLSIYFKIKERNSISLRMGVDARWEGGLAPTVNFNAATMITTIESGIPTTTFVGVGNGWYRCTMTANCISSGASGTTVI